MLNKNSKENLIEVSFQEIHTDENGNEYTKKQVSKHWIFKILPVIFVISVILSCFLIAINTVSGVFLLAAVLVIFSRPVRVIIIDKIINSLIKTNKYFDDRGV